MLQMSKEVFLQLKRKSAYNYYMNTTDFASLNEQEAAYVMGMIEDNIQAELTLAETDYPPLIWFQVSTETIAEDDELFLLVTDAIADAIEKSKKNNRVYIVWAYQNNVLPYPVRLVYDNTVYAKMLNVQRDF